MLEYTRGTAAVRDLNRVFTQAGNLSKNTKEQDTDTHLLSY